MRFTLDLCVDIWSVLLVLTSTIHNPALHANWPLVSLSFVSISRRFRTFRTEHFCDYEHV